MTAGAAPVLGGASARLDVRRVPAGSVLRLYHPPTQGNSFSLDGFPTMGTVPERGLSPKDWQTRLRESVDTLGILGMTTNQTLFRQLLETGALEGRLRAFRAQGFSAEEVYRRLYNEAATEAARIFGEVHARWPWEGRVSQEASALLTELDPLVRDVQRIASSMSGVGAFTKIPNLRIGPQAIQKAVASGKVHPNVTLVFSDRHYLDTVEGYLLGLKELAGRQRLDGIHSVNSLFVSRLDRAVDPLIEEGIGRATDPAQADRLKLLRGKSAVAHAKKVYQIFEAVFLGRPFQDPEGLYRDEEGGRMLERIRRLAALFEELKAAGAHPQRLLVASTGVKSDQPYSPLLYVLPFLGPWCANTLPEATLEVLSRFVSGLPEEQVAALRNRNLMREPLPEIPTDAQPTTEWDRALLMDADERRQSGIREISPDRILRELQGRVLQPKGTTLREICDALRDKGAKAFSDDEQATLQALRAKLQSF